jgi:hypothetical protein
MIFMALGVARTAKKTVDTRPPTLKAVRIVGLFLENVSPRVFRT